MLDEHFFTPKCNSIVATMQSNNPNSEFFGQERDKSFLLFGKHNFGIIFLGGKVCRGTIKITFAYVNSIIKSILNTDKPVFKVELENDVAASAPTLVVVHHFLVETMDNGGEVRAR